MPASGAFAAQFTGALDSSFTFFDVAGPSQHKFSETLCNFQFCGSLKRTILWKFQLEFGKKINGLWRKVKKIHLF